MGTNAPTNTYELNDQDLMAALEAQQAHQGKVAEQTSNWLFFVGVSVAPD